MSEPTYIHTMTNKGANSNSIINYYRYQTKVVFMLMEVKGSEGLSVGQRIRLRKMLGLACAVDILGPGKRVNSRN